MCGEIGMLSINDSVFDLLQSQCQKLCFLEGVSDYGIVVRRVSHKSSVPQIAGVVCRQGATCRHTRPAAKSAMERSDS